MTRIKTIFRSFTLALGLTQSTYQQATTSAQEVSLNPCHWTEIKYSSPVWVGPPWIQGPYSDIASMDVIGQKFEGLYRIKNAQEVELGQAASVKVSEDGLTHTFTQWDDIYWSNGDPVKSRLLWVGLAVDRQPYERDLDWNSLRMGQLSVRWQACRRIRGQGYWWQNPELTLEHPVPALLAILTGSRYMPMQPSSKKRIAMVHSW